VMTLLGLLTGIVQAYIFFILATVYIAAATRAQNSAPTANTESNSETNADLDRLESGSEQKQAKDG